MTDNKLLQSINRIAEGVESIAIVLNKPESKLKQVLQLVGLGATIFGIVASIDIVRNWIIGG